MFFRRILPKLSPLGFRKPSPCLYQKGIENLRNRDLFLKGAAGISIATAVGTWLKHQPKDKKEQSNSAEKSMRR